MTDDTKKQFISALAGLAGALGGSAGTYKLMEYRLDSAEERLAAVEATVEQTGDEVKCMICSAHDIACPGCD